MKCRVCGEKMVLLEEVYDCKCEGLVYGKKPFQHNRKNIKLYQCNKCSHIQSKYLLDDNFYEAYDNPFEGSSQYIGNMNTEKEKIKKLKYYSAGDSIIEIGCGIGNLLKVAQSEFAECVGVEPSNTYKIAKKSGLDVIHAYFNSDLKLKTKYAAFISCQVLEHVEDIYAVLDYAYDILIDGGVGLVNVPNGQYIIDNSLYHQVLAEHVNYFTPASLNFMAHRIGFEILEVENDIKCIELNLYVQKPKNRIGFEKNKILHKNILNDLCNKANSITIWGAGGKSNVYAQFLDKDMPIKHIVDNSNEKKNLYISGIDIPIEKPSDRIIEGSDLIVIFASSYNNDIMEELKNRYNYDGKIVYFEGEIIKILK